MSLTPLASQCGAGDCPTVYISDRDTVVVQGYAVAPEDAGMTVPHGELLVEIPPVLLRLAVEKLTRP